MIDRLVDGPNKVVMGWKEKVEVMWRTHPYSLTRRRKWAEEHDCCGYTTVEDNVGKVVVNVFFYTFVLKVVRPRHNDDPKKRGGYLKGAAKLAVKNRICSSHHRYFGLCLTLPFWKLFE